MVDLSRLILIGDRFTETARQKRILEAVRAGVPWVHLRDHGADQQTFRQAALSLTERIAGERSSTRVSVNQRLDIAAELGVDYHAGSHGASAQSARERLGPAAVVGFSAHERKEVAGAGLESVDYFFYSPIFPTGSKPGHPGTGLAELSRVCVAADVPVFALGGITPRRVSGCLHEGAFGVAVLSGIMEANDAGRAAEAYLRNVRAAIARMKT